MATAHGLTQAPPGWSQQAQLLQAKEQMPWQLNGGVSMFPLNGQNLDPAQFRQLHQDWVKNLQSTDSKQPTTEDTSSDPSRQGSEEVLTLKEKNRRAQQKFRAKQKAKLSEAETRVADLAEQLQDLKSQLAAAESRNVVLEKVFELQSSSSGGPHPREPSPDAALSDDDQPSTSGSELVPYNMCKSISTPIDINAILNSRKQQRTLIQFTPSELKSLEWEDFVKLWKEYVSRLAICLVDANGQEGSPAAKRVEAILDEVLQFFCYLSASHPKKAVQFKHLRLDGNAAEEAPGDEMWRGIAKALNLGEQQQLQICGSRQYLVSNLSKIMEEREEISAQLGSAVASQGERGLQHQLATGHMQARRATEKLHQNLQQAQESLSRFQIANKAIMTPLQVAMVCVQAYPWMPDILALTNAVAKLREGHEEPCSKKPTHQVKNVS